MHLPDLTGWLTADASIPIGSFREEFWSYFRDEIAKWIKVLKFSGARLF